MGLGAISAKLKKTLTMDKKWINKNKDLLYENSVSLATEAALTLEEDIFYSKKNLLKKRLVTRTSSVIRRVSS